MLHVILDVHSQMGTHMQARIWVKMHGSTCGLGSTKCAPALFSELGFCMASCSSIYLSIYIYIYIIGSETMGAQEERDPTSFIMMGGHKFSNWTLKENL